MSADELAITEQLYRYAELIDAGDFDGVGRMLGDVSGHLLIDPVFARSEHGRQAPPQP